MKSFRKIKLWFGDACMLCLAGAGCVGMLYPGWNIAGALYLFLSHMAMLLVCFTAAQLLFGGYRKAWGTGGAYLRLMLSTLCGTGLYVVTCHQVLLRPALEALPLAVTVSLWLLGMLFVRFAGSIRPAPMETAIVGTNDVCVQLLRQLRKAGGWRVRCFFTGEAKGRRRIRGVKVCRTLKHIPARLAAKGICRVIVAPEALSPEERRPLLRELLAAEGVEVSLLPEERDTKAALPAQLRPLGLEDLLGRTALPLDPAAMEAALSGKVVLVTGGGGSVGSALCRQIAKYRPAKLIVLDHCENGVCVLQEELKSAYGAELNLRVEIADVREESRLRQMFACHRPQVVFHAAAYQQAPLMEQCPREAVRTNVFGTWNTVRLAEKFGAERVVLISSHQAVEPMSVLGATRRLCEMMVRAREGAADRTVFTAVRLGDVLESNGSVVPVLRRQIAAGGPVVLPAEGMTRYFMSVDEAVRLALTAGAMARQNEVYVLNMGRPIKIMELAEDLIRLHSLQPHQDIKIVEAGMQPGDKRNGKLFLPGSRVEKTADDRIFVEHQPAVSDRALRGKLTVLTAALTSAEAEIIRKALRDVVPGYIP